MKDGLWINYRTGKEYPIDEHERWLRRDNNAKKLGLSSKLIDSFEDFEPTKDRNKFLLFLMSHAPIMRVRGHGNYVTFEFSNRSSKDAVDSIWMWGLKNAGDYTNLYIVNFKTNEKTTILWKDFKDAMDSGGSDAVMRAATNEKFKWNEKVAKELIAISKSILGVDLTIE